MLKKSNWLNSQVGSATAVSASRHRWVIIENAAALGKDIKRIKFPTVNRDHRIFLIANNDIDSSFTRCLWPAVGVFNLTLPEDDTTREILLLSLYANDSNQLRKCVRLHVTAARKTAVMESPRCLEIAYERIKSSSSSTEGGEMKILVEIGQEIYGVDATTVEKCLHGL